jgi:o-succinylbenzoate---CoA ligase
MNKTKLDFTKIQLQNTNSQFIFNEDISVSPQAFQKLVDDEITHNQSNSTSTIFIETVDPVVAFAKLLAAWSQEKCAVIFPETHNEEMRKKLQECIHGKKSTLDKIKGATLVIFTSGSTGTPKAIVHSLEALIISAQASLKFYNMSANDTWGLSLPHYHIGGLMIFLRAFINKSSLYLLPKSRSQLNKTISSSGRKIHFLSLVHAQLASLLIEAHAVENLKRMKAILVGGGPVSEKTLQLAIKEKLPLSPTYGMSEMGSQIMAVKTTDFLNGKIQLTALEHVHVSCDSDQSIIVEGPSCALMHIDDNKVHLYEKKIITNDLGSFDDNGGLILLGRKDHIFISGGKNISPLQIEEVLNHLPCIKHSYVVPVPHKEFGEVAYAFIDSTLELTLDKQGEELKTKLAAHLEKYQIPKHFQKMPQDIPLKGIKVDRKKLQDLASLSLRQEI